MKRRRHIALVPALKWRGFALSAAVVHHLPLVATAVVPVAARVAFIVAHRQRRSVLQNLQMLEPDAAPEHLQRLAYQVFRSVALYYVELLRISDRSLASIDSYIHVDGYEHLTAALGHGRGVIIAGIHIGPAEIVLHALAARGHPYTTMVERIEPPQLANLLLSLRQSHGQRYVYPDRAGTRELVRVLRHGGLIALLVDRDVIGSGVTVSFCGAPLRAPAGPIELAQVTRAAIVPAVARWTPTGAVAVTVLPEFHLSGTRRDAAAVQSNLERLLAVFEPHLRRAPGQWLVLEPLWLRPGIRSAAYTQ